MMATDLDENLDFTKTCRLCLNQNNELTSTFDMSSFKIQYCIIINECTGVMILENDKLPKNICLKCVECLKKFYKFRKLVVRSEYYLNNFFNNLNKDVTIEKTANIKNELDSDQDPDDPICPFENDENLYNREENSIIESEFMIHKEELKIEESNPPITEPTKSNEFITEATSIVTTFEENDKSHVFTLVHNSCESFTCEICGENLTSTEDPNLHLKSCTKQKDSTLYASKEIFSLPQLTKPKKLNNNSKTSYVCKQCNKSFRTSWHLKRHEPVHIGKDQVRSEISSSSHLAKSKTYVCKQCNKGFYRLYTLKRHTHCHTGKRPYVCDQCGKSFIEAYDLKKHQRTHTDENPYVCKQCNKSFHTSWHLKRHNVCHTGERLYICDQCGKSYLDLSNLKTHEKIHTGEKPHKCKLCGHSFRTDANLKEHNRIHTGEKPFVCTECGKSFSQSSSLGNHKKLIHGGERPYACQPCGKSFISLSFLKRHERVHTGEKLYSCDQCGKSFTHSGTLKQHKSIHTDERLYKCDQCEKSFKFSASLRKHKIIHHKDEKS